VIRLPILALAVTLGLAAAGCGGGDEPEGVPPSEWAASVCGALATWQTTLEQGARDLTRDVLQAQDPEQSKEQIGAFLDEVIAETDTVIGAVDEAGAPAVDQGEQVAADFKAGLEQIRSAFAGAGEQIEEAPTDDPAAFQQQLGAIGQQLQTQGQSIGDTLGRIDEKYDSDELGEAFDENEQCREFAG
jgi:hypothetical protein